MTPAELRAHIVRLVDDAPPFAEGTRTRLAALLQTPAPVRRAVDTTPIPAAGRGRHTPPARRASRNPGAAQVPTSRGADSGLGLGDTPSGAPLDVAPARPRSRSA